MQINQTKCDRCGFTQPNPTPYISQTVIRLKRPGQEPAAIDKTLDLCVKCFESVEAALIVAMDEP